MPQGYLFGRSMLDTPTVPVPRPGVVEQCQELLQSRFAVASSKSGFALAPVDGQEMADEICGN